MKKDLNLIEFNADNVSSDGTGVAAVSISIKTGIFFFSKSAKSVLDLSPGDMIQFLQDANEKTDWYIEKVKKGGFVLRVNKSKNFTFNNTVIARKIHDSLSDQDKSIRLLIAGQPTKFEKRTLWGLLSVSKG
jgi:hypothetical protein